MAYRMRYAEIMSTINTHGLTSKFLVSKHGLVTVYARTVPPHVLELEPALGAA